ncbi:hypothetical protein J5N97_009945 [Dioscorea zingiberensis]|uniref:SMP domain-containing protein n=1 Tax=Dioscorea zingiberensis TaxID=325984 RepID=A0A9D5HLZ5_9LILI|nr:hypothetical protein J5N97_009945 [Dioscorea zingiberensis]
MSQGQQRRREVPVGVPEPEPNQPITYGDVFEVSGVLAEQAVAPEDAAMMQSAESTILGHTQPGGAAAVIQSAAEENERAGLVSPDEASDMVADLGVSVSESHIPGRHLVTESVAGQVVAQYPSATPPSPKGAPKMSMRDVISIGEALEAAALTAGDKPVSRSDAAAIQAAEARVIGGPVSATGGLAAEAQAAAAANELVMRDEDKTKLSDVLSDATLKLRGDKDATREDAEKVVGAELRNNPAMVTHPGGVADTVAAAARLNQETQG